MMKVLSIALAVVVSVLLSYAVGTSAGVPEKQALPAPLWVDVPITFIEPDSSAPLRVPCGSDMIIASGLYTPTTDVTVYRVTFMGGGMGHLYFDPQTFNDWTGINLVSGRTLNTFEFQAPLYDRNRFPTPFSIRAVPADCYHWNGPFLVGHITVSAQPR